MRLWMVLKDYVWRVLFLVHDSEVLCEEVGVFVGVGEEGVVEFDEEIFVAELYEMVEIGLWD